MKIFSNSFFAVSASDQSPQVFKRDVPKCYDIDGNQSSVMFACDLSATFSPCCMVASVCLDNKLCQVEGTIVTYRGGCTDLTWNSSDCPRICLGK